jgi:thiamine-monophosphate kinase
MGHMVTASEGAHLITRGNTKLKLEARGWNALK